MTDTELTFPQKLTRAKQLGYDSWAEGERPLGNEPLSMSPEPHLKELSELLNQTDSHLQRAKILVHYSEGWDQKAAAPDAEKFEAVIPVYIPHGYVLGDEVIQGRAVIHDDTLHMQLNEGQTFSEHLKHGRVIALTMTLPPETQNPYGPPLIEQIRAILKPEWTQGRLMPAYVGAAEHARLNAIEALVNAFAEQP